MKIVIHDDSGLDIHSSKAPQPTELPRDTKVDFYNKDGDKFEITLNDSLGINVRLVRKNGKDQVSVLPHTANFVEIK